jgi:hypothetical protein
MKITYQDNIVAFIDVLGFSEIVYSNTTQSINKYFDIILNTFCEATVKNHFKFILVSDSIVVTAKNNNSNVKQMVKVLCKLQEILLVNGILLRGAISFGKLYLNKSKNIIVGPGLINAYRLESQTIYPRIILDRRFISQFYNGTTSIINNMQYGYGPIDLLIFNPPSPYIADFPYLNYTSLIGFYKPKKEYNNIIQFLKDNYYLNEHIGKYEWLKRHLLDATIFQIKHLTELPIKSRSCKRNIRYAIIFLEELQKL